MGSTPTTANDLNIIADLLEMCTGIPNDLDHVVACLRSDDMPGLRALLKYGTKYDFSQVMDVLNYANELYAEGTEFAEEASFEAHLKVTSCGYFNYYDYCGEDFEATLRIIHENHDRVDEILTFLKDRGPDGEALNVFLSNPSRPLSGGTL